MLAEIKIKQMKNQKRIDQAIVLFVDSILNFDADVSSAQAFAYLYKSYLARHKQSMILYLLPFSKRREILMVRYLQI